ncbi:C-type lectin lectoxin-Lio1-like [Branchiostoma lanceolatum]|uniref:C-type lectin lectoxin-Lio1-like n=1 Tax=Branchiostoma lanceolatum TaxID=7740 RepID=UPI0034536D0C
MRNLYVVVLGCTLLLSLSWSDASVCHWEGTASSCDPGNCDWGRYVRSDGCGDGRCCLTGSKIYCCNGRCPSGWQQYSSKCYKAYSIFKTWRDASDYCREQGPGGMLAMAKDSGTNKFLIHLKDAESSLGFWFGLNDRAREGRWKWPDGSSLWSFKYWAPNQPDNGNQQKYWSGAMRPSEACVEYLSTGRWNDYICYKTRYFICEREAEGL